MINCENLHLDGNYQIIRFPFKQLITVLIRDPMTNKGIPAAYILTSGKSYEDYMSAFSTLRNMITNFDINKKYKFHSNNN